MVQTDLTQLNRECNSWRENLKGHRTDLTNFRVKLQETVTRPLNRADMPQVEHYDNQIDIQLNNISQLKHEIKDHERNAAWELGRTSGNVSDITWTQHESLLDRYEILEHTIGELKEEFKTFMSKFS
jgi:predicted  nucleic acid-binding Zn-ribbon protein